MATDKKVKKYVSRINEVLNSTSISVRKLLSLHVNLTFAGVVAPFGRQFLAALSCIIAGKRPTECVQHTQLIRMGLRIWKQLLICNRGISYDFILSRLPRAKDDIFFDASTTWGIGGCSGTLYFAIPWCEIDDSFKHDIIVRKELLAALVALECFSRVTKGELATAFTDNSNCVQRGLKSGLGWGRPRFCVFFLQIINIVRK